MLETPAQVRSRSTALPSSFSDVRRRADAASAVVGYGATCRCLEFEPAAEPLEIPADLLDLPLV